MNPSEQPTPKIVRGVRLVRAGLHVARGLATTVVVFPFASHTAKKRMIRRWSRGLLSIFAVELDHAGGAIAPGRPVVIVANHISWLDIFVIHAFEPSRFVAKSDIKDWPVIGRLVANVGTLFVDRTRRRDTARINE